ncbi:HAD family hydrolase [Candidatus Saccharibacteria bacterium]|nr:HAD family hydrolase [Candidatus Saccharibacteria bacterium]
MKKYKILIFDLDDTLIDNHESVRVAFETMLTAVGETYSNEKLDRWYRIDADFWSKYQDGLIKIPPEFAHETARKSDKFLDWVCSQRVLQYFENKVDDERAIELNDIYISALAENVVAIEGARDTLKYLASENVYKIIVATNGPSLVVPRKLEIIGVSSYVTEILAADMLGLVKPHTEFFDAIKKRYNDFLNSDYLMIGNSLKSDVGFAMKVGIDSCWFNRKKEKLTLEYAPTFVIQDLRQLKTIL